MYAQQQLNNKFAVVQQEDMEHWLIMWPARSRESHQCIGSLADEKSDTIIMNDDHAAADNNSEMMMVLALL